MSLGGWKHKGFRNGQIRYQWYPCRENRRDFLKNWRKILIYHIYLKDRRYIRFYCDYVRKSDFQKSSINHDNFSFTVLLWTHTYIRINNTDHCIINESSKYTFLTNYFLVIFLIKEMPIPISDLERTILKRSDKNRTSSRSDR